jgi:hypothetical protein
MKKKVISKKLLVNKKTIVHLDKIGLDLVKGGVITGTCDCDTDVYMCTNYTGCMTNFNVNTCQHTC